MNGRSLRNWLFVGCLLALFFCLLGFSLFPRYTSDAEWYIAIAQGHFDVPKPWGSRILHALLAGSIARLTGISLDLAFYILAVVSTFIIGLGLACLSHRVHGNAWHSLWAFNPFLLQAVGSIYLNDLFLLSLCIVFFAVLEIPWLAFPLVILMSLTREVSLIAALVSGSVLVYKGKRLYGASIVLLAALAYLFIIPAIAKGQNLHGSSDFIYLVGRSFAAFFKNFFGFQIWTDTLASLWEKWDMSGCETPLVAFTLPPKLRIGNIHAIGLCPWNPWHIIYFLATYLCGWGLLLGMLWTLRGNFANLVAIASPNIVAACLFGLASLLLAPFVTYDFALGRLSIYAIIPLVVIAPSFMQGCHRVRGVLIPLIHVALLMAFLLALKGLMNPYGLAVLTVFGILGQFFAVYSCFSKKGQATLEVLEGVKDDRQAKPPDGEKK